MLTLEKLRRKPEKFHAFTGLTPDEFDTVLAGVEPVYAAAQETRRNYPCRRRAVGAGHLFTLSVAERLLLVLIYWRVYLTQGLLGFLFELDDSNVSREIGRMRPVLLQVLPVPMRDSNLLQPASTSPPHRVATLTELLEQHPEFEELLIDATEQPIFRPQAKQARRQRFSGKHKQHMIKTQVVTTTTVVTHLIGEIPGCVHDHMLLQGSGVFPRIPTDRRIRLDLGYEGVEQLYPDHLIEKGIRGQRGHTVTILGKLYNRMLSRLRIPVEHMIGRLKQFNVLAFLYRGRWSDHEDTMTVIAGLVNFVALGRLTWAEPT
jgi:hypothetical protein